MFKVEKGQKPSYILSIFRLFRAIPIRFTQNPRPYVFAAHSSVKKRNSPVYQLMKTFNSLNNNTRSINSFSLFKYRITRRNFDLKDTSTILLNNLTRREEIYLNKLRVDFLLNSHLYSHNFVGVDSPNCRSCKVVNSTVHFLCRCQSPIHRPRITTLLNALQQLEVMNIYNNLNLSDKTKFLLYGHKDFDLNTNMKIIKLTAVFAMSYYKFR